MPVIVASLGIDEAPLWPLTIIKPVVPVNSSGWVSIGGE